MSTTSAYAQPIGEAVNGWTTRERPARIVIEGTHCRIAVIDVARGKAVGTFALMCIEPVLA